jgi:PKHD-type hydroxylase
MNRQLFPVGEFMPNVPNEQFAIWRGGFSAEQCEMVQDIASLLKFEHAQVGDDPNQSQEDKDHIRNSDITWIQPTHENDWMFFLMKSLVERVNYDKFQLELEGFDSFQFTSYKLNQHYNWHTDTQVNVEHPMRHRKLSVVMMLTDPDEYEGGDLLLAPGGNFQTPEVIRAKKGDVIFFYSHIPHTVTPVTSGERQSLVTWLQGPKLR